MCTTNSNVEKGIKDILKNKNIKNLKIEVLGNSEKGDGFVGDIVFVRVTGTAKNEERRLKEYNLVLKCSKQSEFLRKTFPVQEFFANENLLYRKIFPRFLEFQLEKGIKDPFQAIPKYYGTYMNDSREIIALENLKMTGYALWDKSKPLPRSHIDLVISEYAKFHAVSVALNDQHPKEFNEYVVATENVFEIWKKLANIEAIFGTCIEEAIGLLTDELEENIVIKWQNFRKQFGDLFHDNIDGLKVMVHGDCWNNNFMYQYSQSENPEDSVTNCAILDWQLARATSPIYDLSYFLFSCISQEDLLDIGTILQNYHQTFSKHLEKMGSNPEKLYPTEQFYKEWKIFCKYGLSMASGIAKFISADKSELPDLAENGKLAEFFQSEIKNTNNIKRRLKHIFEYAVNNDVI